MNLPTHYVSSDGRQTAIGELVFTHAANALAKLERRGDGSTPMANALRQELARRAIEEPAPTATVDHKDYKLAKAEPAPVRGIGDNNPPTFEQELEAGAADLLQANADLELDKGALPKSPNSDDDVAQITAWCVRARALARQSDRTHDEIKKPYLEKGKIIDRFFKGIADALKSEASKIEQRSGPYLEAKRKAAEAEQARIAAEARRAEEERREVARKEQEAAAEAQRQKDAAEKAIRDAADAVAAEEARIAFQAAAKAQQEAQDAADQAAKDAVKLGRAADKADKAQGGVLERTAAGGGAARLTKEWRWEVTDRDACRNSLGPWAGFISATAIDEALNRGARAEVKPNIPGVRFYEETVVATHATRS